MDKVGNMSTIHSLLKKIPRILLFSFVCIQTARGNWDCDKYCHKSCQEYFNERSEFSACVEANVRCDCHLKFSIRNPFVIAGLSFLIFLIIVGICCCCLCYHKFGRCRRRGVVISNTPIVACPTISVPPVTASLTFGQQPTGTAQYPPTEYNRPPPFNVSAAYG